MIPNFRIRHIRQKLQSRLLLDLRETARNRQSTVPAPEFVERSNDYMTIHVDSLSNDSDEFGHQDGLLDAIVERLGSRVATYGYPSWHTTTATVQNTQGFQPWEIAEYLTSRWQTGGERSSGRVSDYLADGSYEEEVEDEDGKMVNETYYWFTERAPFPNEEGFHDSSDPYEYKVFVFWHA